MNRFHPIQPAHEHVVDLKLMDLIHLQYSRSVGHISEKAEMNLKGSCISMNQDLYYD